MLALVIIEGVVVAMLAFLVVGLLKSHAEILRQLHELAPRPAESEFPPELPLGPRPVPVGTRAHDLVGETPDGEAVAISVAGAAHHTLVAFLSSGCATCGEFWHAFATPDQLGLPPRTRLVVVTRGVEADSVTAIRDVAPANATVVMSTEGWESYAVPGSPYFVLVDGPAGAVVGEGTGTTWTQVQSLMSQALGDRSAQANRSARKRRTDRDRADWDEAELLAAGIGPGHASLFASAPSSPANGAPTTTAPTNGSPTNDTPTTAASTNGAPTTASAPTNDSPASRPPAGGTRRPPSRGIGEP